jgi:hypothetical protein
MQTTESKYIFACQKQNKDMKLLLSVRTWSYILVLFILDFFVLYFVNLMQVYQEKRLIDKERYRIEMLKYKSNGSAP